MTGRKKKQDQESRRCNCLTSISVRLSMYINKRKINKTPSNVTRFLEACQRIDQTMISPFGKYY